MATFTYFTFQPLTLAEFQNHYPQLSFEDAQEILDFWLLDYYEKSPDFYQSQANQHREMLRKQFLTMRGVTDYEAEIYELKDEWEEFIADTKLRKHEAMCEEKVHLAYQQQKELEKKKYGNVDSKNLFDFLIERVDQKAKFSGPSIDEVWAMWFNSLFNNPPEVQKQLKQMPYKDYLWTEHWRRVRAAMLLRYRAVCQAQYCVDQGESWYGAGWEKAIHVHHFTYKNRGNERHDDLTLLCREHHEMWNAHEKDTTKPKVTFPIF